MSTAELARPGVEVIQSFRRSSPTITKPTLVPVVVGPAFEVLNVLTEDGTLNQKARHSTYAQLGKVLTHSAFPDPRRNIDELDVQLGSVRPFLLSGGKLTELPMTPGESFLAASHLAGKAAVKVVGDSFSVGGKNLVLAIDTPVATDVTRDVTVVFSGEGILTAKQVVDAINTAFGMEIATITVDEDDKTTGFQLSSPRHGALSSITVRASGTANGFFQLGWKDGETPTPAEERVEGCGYRAQDLQNNTTASTWVEFHQGAYLVDTVEVTGAWPAKVGLVDLDGTFASNKAPAVTFGPSGSIPLVAGDQVFVDGIRLKGGEVSKVEPRRFKIGTINTLRSLSDEAGNYTAKVYDEAPIGLLSDNAPFAPSYVYFRACGLTEGPAKAASLLSAAAPVAAVSAKISATNAPSLNLKGLRIAYVVTINGEPVEGVYVFTADEYVDAAAVAEAIEIPGVVVTVVDDKLVFETSETGKDQGLVILSSSEAFAAIGFTGTSSKTAEGEDSLFTGAAGKNLKFSFNRSVHVYDVAFDSDSIEGIIAELNAAVGTTVAAKDEDGEKIVLSSYLPGVSSLVHVRGGDAAVVLGFDTDPSSPGTGRPNPDAFLDDAGSLNIGSELVRDPVTGRPLDFATSQASLFIQYKALRKDVSPAAIEPGVLRLPDVDTLSTVLDPVTEENPLALGCYFAMLNCPTFELKALGVDEVSGSAPEGTELAYARAAAMLEAEEVYAIAPLTHNEVVHGLFMTHATIMSEPEQSGERIVFVNKKTPVRKVAKIAANGPSANSTATPNQLLLDVTPQAGLLALGLNPSLPLAAADGVFVELSWEGAFYRYSVSKVSGGLAYFRTVFAAGENDDFFYSTVPLPSGMVDVDWTMKVRGASLAIPGSNPPKLDYSLVADTVAEANLSFSNRRAFSVFPEKVKATLNGADKTLPGYYACAAIAGAVAGYPPQQGFTNLPIVGITGLVGTEKFTKKQLNRMAGGGTYILAQEVQGGAVFSRHQLSTDTTSVETRELSITKVVDFVAKFLRTGVRRFIGQQNINSVFLDTIGTTIQGMLSFLTENGIINGANLNNIIQDEKAPDTVLLDVTLDVPFPCNYIRLTLVV